MAAPGRRSRARSGPDPAPDPAPDLGWLLSTPIAHRGLHDADAGVPENTLAAFAAAADAGYPVELDVHLTGDGHVVVVHDDHLGRLTGADVRVSASSLVDLRRHRLLGSPHTVPTLGAVLDEIGGRVGVMVELKNHQRVAGRLEQAVASLLDDYRGPVCVASFNPRSVRWFADHRPHVVRAQTAGVLRDVDMPRWLRLLLRSMAANVRTHPHLLSYELAGLPNPFVTWWRRRDRPLLAWTVRTEADRARADVLADNYIFEGIVP